MTSLLSKCPNCAAPMPIFTHIRWPDSLLKESTANVVVECTCYSCGKNLDLSFKLGTRAELQKASS